MATEWKNTDALHSILGGPGREMVFQALCTERDRLAALGDADAAERAKTLADLYGANLVADQCCGLLRQTHAYCEPARVAH